MKNTKIEFLYRDGSNYKVHNCAVVKGPYTKEQLDRIEKSLEFGDAFIPEMVGLPVKRFDRWTDDDTPFCEICREDFAETDEAPTVNMTMDDLTQKFESNTGLWMEVALMVLMDGMLGVPRKEETK